jgi:hypothetical protein
MVGQPIFQKCYNLLALHCAFVKFFLHVYY